MKRIRIETNEVTVEISYSDPIVAQRAVQHLFTAISYDVSTLHKLIVTGYVGDKISAIKAIRSVTGMGLREAKVFVEDAQAGKEPVLFENLGHEKTESVTRILSDVGVTFVLS